MKFAEQILAPFNLKDCMAWPSLQHHPSDKIIIFSLAAVHHQCAVCSIQLFLITGVMLLSCVAPASAQFLSEPVRRLLKDILACASRKSTGVNNKVNEDLSR